MSNKTDGDINSYIEEEKLAEVAKIADIISHDIRNPLSAIKNGMYFLGYSIKSDDQRIGTTINIINKEIENIERIVNNLLDYSRQRPPQVIQANINSLLDEVISQIELPEKVSIVKDFDNKIPPYDLDCEEIGRALMNVINNAWQSCEKNGGTVTVSTMQEKSGDLKIIVKDNGIGIAVGDLGRIFDPFYSTKDGKTGLGLAAVKRILERHNGCVVVNSIPDTGTDVTLAIPKGKNRI